MLERLTHQLLTALQLTRMALVFTAISNSLCALLLTTARDAGPGADLLALLNPAEVIAVALISIGLYGFGMSLNDIIDRRRDQQLAAHRPLPSGRIRPLAAHLICLSLGLLALAGGILYAVASPAGWRSLALLIWTGFLIVFYDVAGKYLVGTGLLTLGLIRLFHAAIPAPNVPLLWHPLLLFTHVTCLSAVAYAWEEKRPPLTRLHWGTVLGSVAAIDLLAVGVVLWKAMREPPQASLWIKGGLLLPLILALAFVLVAWLIRRRATSQRQAGQTLMLVGLLWLILYDSAFAAAYAGWQYAAGLFLLLPIAYLSVRLMRWWAGVLALSQQPTYKRFRGRSEISR